MLEALRQQLHLAQLRLSEAQMRVVEADGECARLRREIRVAQGFCAHWDGCDCTSPQSKLVIGR